MRNVKTKLIPGEEKNVIKCGSEHSFALNSVGIPNFTKNISHEKNRSHEPPHDGNEKQYREWHLSFNQVLFGVAKKCILPIFIIMYTIVLIPFWPIGLLIRRHHDPLYGLHPFKWYPFDQQLVSGPPDSSSRDG